MREVLTLTLAGLLRARCAHPLIFTRYDGAPTSDQDFRQASYRCVQESRQTWAAGGSGLIGVSLMLAAQADAQARANQLYVQCMGAAGYRPLTAEEMKTSGVTK